MDQVDGAGRRVAGTARVGRRADERERELTALLDVAADLTSTLELEPLLDRILEQLLRVLDYRTAGIFLARDDSLETVASRDTKNDAGAPRYIGHRRPLAQVAPIWQALRRGEPLLIGDVHRDDHPLSTAWRTATSSYRPDPLSHPVRAWLAAPLSVRGRVAGYLALTREVPDSFTVRDVELAVAFAGHAAIAIENARLYEQEHRTARELASLLEVAQNVASTLELEPLIDVVLDQIKVVADYDGASLVAVDGDTLRMMRRRAPTDFEPGYERAVAVPLERAGGAWELVQGGQPVVIGDIRGDEPLARAYREGVRVPVEDSHLRYIRSWMAVPLAHKSRVIGMIVLAHGEVRHYTERHAALVSGIASQAAIAIENARLYGEGQKLAALEERQRLARELHDSVSQVLFSIGLGARTTRALLDRGDAARAIPSVEYIAKLAEMGTAEMRALLFELRPESLQQEGLVAALAKQAAALGARHGIAVEADLGEEPPVSLDAKEALYRIAQEATHNTVKHARAARIDIRLAREGECLALDVADDGVGFDASGAFPGHLGLVSMRERVARLGGTLSIESAPGRGTALRVRVPAGLDAAP